MTWQDRLEKLKTELNGQSLTLIELGWPTTFQLEDGRYLVFDGIPDEMEFYLTEQIAQVAPESERDDRINGN